MKRVDLLRRLVKAARTAGVSFEIVREGGSHTVYRYGGRLVSVPRDREINERTARSILATVGIEA